MGEETLRLGIIGDFDPERRSHVATNRALEHAGEAATLFLPQLSSEASTPHPLILAFLESSARSARSRATI